MKQQKDENIEILRVVSCIMVICIHVANYYCRNMAEISVPSYVFACIINGVSRISVPLFLMISGSLLIGRPVDIERNKMRVIKILKPLVIWSLVYALWNYYYRDRGYYNLKDTFEEPVKKHLWYLYVLIGIYLTLPFWQKLFSDMQEEMVKYFVLLYICLLTINFVLAFQHMEVRYQIPLVGSSCHLGYFIMGYIIRQYKEKIWLRRIWASCIAVIAISMVIGSTMMYSFQKGSHVEDFFEYRNVLIGVAAMAVFYIVIKAKDFVIPGGMGYFTEIVSKHSFNIYLAHILFLDILKEEISMRDFSAFLGVPMFSAMIFSATLLFSYILEQMSSFLKKRKM